MFNYKFLEEISDFEKILTEWEIIDKMIYKGIVGIIPIPFVFVPLNYTRQIINKFTYFGNNIYKWKNDNLRITVKKVINVFDVSQMKSFRILKQQDDQVWFVSELSEDELNNHIIEMIYGYCDKYNDLIPVFNYDKEQNMVFQEFKSQTQEGLYLKVDLNMVNIKNKNYLGNKVDIYIVSKRYNRFHFYNLMIPEILSKDKIVNFKKQMLYQINGIGEQNYSKEQLNGTTYLKDLISENLTDCNDCSITKLFSAEISKLKSLTINNIDKQINFDFKVNQVQGKKKFLLDDLPEGLTIQVLAVKEPLNIETAKIVETK